MLPRNSDTSPFPGTRGYRGHSGTSSQRDTDSSLVASDSLNLYRLAEPLQAIKVIDKYKYSIAVQYNANQLSLGHIFCQEDTKYCEIVSENFYCSLRNLLRLISLLACN